MSTLFINKKLQLYKYVSFFINFNAKNAYNFYYLLLKSLVINPVLIQ